MKTKRLNLLDIFSLKKDLIWGKYYYGLFEKNKLTDSILYSHLYDDKRLINIINTEKRNKNLLQDFIQYYSKRHKARYFLRELKEQSQAEDISFMRDCGFLRFNKNYCYKFETSNIDLKEKKILDVYCREIQKKDLKNLVSFDQSSQIIEYRDCLYRSKRFFKNNFENIYVFTFTANLSEIVALAIRRPDEEGSTFEFIAHPNQSHIVHQCLIAFAEKYIYFEKFDESFNFVINDNFKNELQSIANNYRLKWSSQSLIREGAPKEKIKNKLKTRVKLPNISSATG